MRIIFALLLVAAFQTIMASSPTPNSRRDINAVLADHDDRLLAIAGVVGVYVALLKDGKTPCLRVMVVEDRPELRKAIPREIEGYPVQIEISGEIKPLG